MDWKAIWNSVSAVCVDLVFKLLGALLLLVIGRALIRFFIKRFPKGSEKHPLDPTVRQFLMNIVKFSLYTLLAISIVGILGVPLASVITVIGTAGAAIALALQGSLGNLASGIMLLIFKPIRLGDYVEASGASGTVTDLGIFYTTLLTPDNCHYTVPNSALTSATIKNYSREETRRLDIVFAVDYHSDLELAKKLILDAVNAHDKSLKDPLPFVRITELGNSAVSITTRIWCKAGDYWDLKFDLTEQVKAILDSNGVVIPYPQLDVHVKQ